MNFLSAVRTVGISSRAQIDYAALTHSVGRAVALVLNFIAMLGLFLEIASDSTAGQLDILI